MATLRSAWVVINRNARHEGRSFTVNTIQSTLPAGSNNRPRTIMLIVRLPIPVREVVLPAYALLESSRTAAVVLPLPQSIARFLLCRVQVTLPNGSFRPPLE